MFELSAALNVLEVTIATLAVVTMGDYLGHKVGRWRLVMIAGGIALVAIIAFAIYAAIVLQIARA
ncbi:MAG: hypothetical protein HYX84_08140 [Chloroflexi bacterium]|nr:hypothetical protein [Chloroflexota bacterium]